jgi:hypothetical protein
VSTEMQACIGYPVQSYLPKVHPGGSAGPCRIWLTPRSGSVLHRSIDDLDAILGRDAMDDIGQRRSRIAEVARMRPACSPLLQSRGFARRTEPHQALAPVRQQHALQPGRGCLDGLGQQAAAPRRMTTSGSSVVSGWRRATMLTMPIIVSRPLGRCCQHSYQPDRPCSGLIINLS